jgi:hypothetical protein
LLPAEPQWLAGDPIRFPDTSEMTAVLGPPARFSADLIAPDFTPGSDWDFSDPERSNSWSPASWSRGWNDPTFTPSGDWDLDPRSGNNWSPVDWPAPPIDYRWVPQHGLAPSDW